MLDTLAKKIQTTVLVLMVGALVAVFVLQFGNQQAEGFSMGGSEVAASVRGHDVTGGDFRAIYTLIGFDRIDDDEQRMRKTREAVIDGIVDRILLAEEARDLGLVVSPEQAMEKLVTDDTVLVTLGQDASPYFPQGELEIGLRDENGNFDREQAEMLIRNRLRRSMGEFAEWQAQERMAERMRDAIRANAAIGEAEVWDAYVAEQDRAQIEYVQFRGAYYRNSLEPSEAELATFIAANEAEIAQDYTSNSHRYTGLPEQVRARHVLIRSQESDTDEEKAAARARAEEARTRIRAGEDFAAVARSMSEDQSSKPRGGDLGFVRRGQQPDAFEEALFGLEVGSVSDVVQTSQGFHVMRAEARREGDVPEAEAKREIAERLYRERQSGDAAESAAREAIAFLRGGGTMEALGARLPGAVAEGSAETADPLVPRVAETPLFGRSENPIRGAGDTTPVLELAFELTEEDPIAEAPVRVGSDWYVVRLTQRQRATEEGFDEATRERIAAQLLATKQEEAVADFTRILRARAEAEGDVHVLPRILSYGAPVEEEADQASGEG
jgi:peptidyl-prolyl cis-trans isomerase D